MKTRIIYTMVMLYACVQLFAQVPQGIQYQIVVRNSDSIPMASQTLSLDVEVVEGSVNGPVVFSEKHTVMTSGVGLAILSIGNLENGIGSMKGIKWGTNDYFLKVKESNRIVSTEKMLVVPFVKYVNTANTVDKLHYSQLKNSPDFSNYDKDGSDDFSGDYEDLINKPTDYFDGEYSSLTGVLPKRIITTEESNTIDSIKVSQEMDVNALALQNEEARALVGTPEFGQKDGTVYEGHTAWKAIDGNMIHPGGVGVNVPIPSEFHGAGMKVNGAIMYDGIPVEGSPGMLFYDPNLDNGSFCYYNEEGEVVVLATGVIEGGGINNLRDKVTFTDYIEDRSLVLGNGASIDRNVGDYSMVIASNVIFIKFDDTSNSSSFPGNDWQIRTNDIEEGGDNYFAFVDATKGEIPFKIEAGAADGAFYIDGQGKVGIGTNMPEEKLQVIGKLKGASYVGDGSQLTGISYSGTGVLNNLGSTTVAADDDSDSKGRIEFAIKDTNRMVIDNNGNVGIGVDDPKAMLVVDGVSAIENVVVEGALHPRSVSHNIVHEDLFGTFSFYDMTGKSIIFLNPTAGTTTLYMQSYFVLGKEWTIVNKNPGNTLNLNYVMSPAGSTIALGPYESARVVYTNSGLVLTSLVKAL